MQVTQDNSLQDLSAQWDLAVKSVLEFEENLDRKVIAVHEVSPVNEIGVSHTTSPLPVARDSHHKPSHDALFVPGVVI